MQCNGQAAPLWRLYNSTSGDHVMTSNASERAALATSGWQPETLSRLKVNRFAELATDRAVTRLFNPNGGQLYYAGNLSERDAL